MPGVTTYLDTPVVPVGAFTGPDQFPLDCEYPDGTPRIFSVTVDNGVGGGPYVPTSGNSDNNRVVDGDRTITITSMGTVSVQNPDYCNPAAGACPTGSDTINKLIPRDYGFGASGTVTLGDLGTLSCTWGEPITCTIPAGTPVGAVGGRQLTVTRGDGASTRAGVTVQVGLRQGAGVIQVTKAGVGFTTIQDAIQAAGTNDLILVAPGRYDESVVMWKPVQLQGWGEGSTIINAINAPADKLQDWRLLVDGLITNGLIDLLPGQEVGLATPEPTQLFTEEGAGVLVLAESSGNSRFEFDRNRGARIDGFTVKSADNGGGIVANGYTDYLQISNNRIANNSGFYGGGIRVGHPLLTDPDNLFYIDADNDLVSIHHNQVVFNGGLGGAGGGISLCTGSDSYAVTENWVCGNFTTGSGGGIGHIGLSSRAALQGNELGPVPVIADNTIIFNEIFNQGLTVSGGGLFIGGTPPIAPGALSSGSGDVIVERNLIQGNSAGAGDGGGIRLQAVNGQDVADNPDNTPPAKKNDPPAWNAVELSNNMIVNNVAGLAGGGISLLDSVAVAIQNNTIANNDSLATAGSAFAPGSPNESTPQPGAGIVSRAHSAQLLAASASVGTFSNPVALDDNIIWQNRQFYFWVDSITGCTPGDPNCTSTFGLCPDPSGALACTDGPAYPQFSDLGVIGAAGALSGVDNLLTPVAWTGPSDPSTLFLAEYFNGARSSVLQPEINTGIQTPAAFDEGGNFIRPGFGPLTLIGDYHILSGSAAHDAAASGLSTDFDLDPRPLGVNYDIGADEIQE
jgi:hypothetical protein